MSEDDLGSLVLTIVYIVCLFSVISGT